MTLGPAPAIAEARPAIPDAAARIAAMNVAGLLLDERLTIHDANPAAEDLLGRSAKRMIGAGVENIIELADPRVWDRLRARNLPLSARGLAMTLSNRPIVGAMSASEVAGEGGWMVVMLQEEAGAAHRGVGRDHPAFRSSAILAHEIKTPLAAISGAAQLLDKRVGQKDAALTGLLVDETARIASLVDRMQVLGRQAGAPNAALNVHSAVRDAVRVFRAGTDAAFILEEEFDPSLPPVHGNHDALVQVLLNLLGNAAEAAAGTDSPRVRIITRFVQGQGGHLPVEIVVTDNGAGVPEQISGSLFEPFVTARAGGQGLGLPLVARLMADMDGTVRHRRTDEGETRFVLSFRPASGATA